MESKVSNRLLNEVFRTLTPLDSSMDDLFHRIVTRSAISEVTLQERVTWSPATVEFTPVILIVTSGSTYNYTDNPLPHYS